MFKYQDTSNMRYAKYWAALALVVLGVLVYLAWDYTRIGTSVDLSQAPTVTEDAKVGFVDAEAKMYEVAKKWQSDSVLSQITSIGAASSEGDTESWQAIFVSPTHEGVGYVVQMNVGGITLEEEVPYVRDGAPFPKDGKTKEQAIAEVRSIAGRENGTIEGIEALYSDVDRVWYWGIKTDGGVVSVRME